MNINGNPTPVFESKYFPEDSDKVGLYGRSEIHLRTRGYYANTVQYRDTLLHEIIHALACDIHGENLTERQVTHLATTLIDTIDRNPRLRKELLGD